MPRPRRVSARNAARATRASASERQEVPETPPSVVVEAEPQPEKVFEDEPKDKENEMEVEEAKEEKAADPPPEETTPAPEVAPTEEASQEQDENIPLSDKSYLINVELGYSQESNLKQPLKGFTPEDEKMTDDQKREVEAAVKTKKGIIKLCDCPRAYLYHLNYLEAPIDADKQKSSKRAPHPFLLTEDENIFSEEKLKMLRSVLDAGWKREVVMRSPGSTGRKTGDVYYYSPEGTKFRSSKQVAQHLAEIKDTPFTIENFSFAKVRISTNPDQEIVRKAYDGKSPPRPPVKTTSAKIKPSPATSKGEPTKIAPKPSTSSSKESVENDQRPTVMEEPVKALSSGRRSIQPPKRYSGDAVVLLSKRSKQDDKHRSSANKGLMQMGMLPPKYPKGMEDSSSNLSENMDFNDGTSQEDRSESNANNMKELADDSLFQISALRQSGGIDVDKMRQYVENQKKLAQKSDHTTTGEEAKQRGNQSRSKRDEIIPCSIRCPGMTGEIPNLQCTRCLCLYHAECLGLPLNLNYPNFLCSNCEANPTSTTATATTSSQEMKKTMLIKKPGELKRPPPPLVRATSLSRGAPPRKEIAVTRAGNDVTTVRIPQKIGVSSTMGMGRGMARGRGMSAPLIRSPSAQLHHGQRMVTSEGVSIVGVSAHAMKRGRGRPPARGLPQLNNRSLTITHLPRILSKSQGGQLPVPNLQPMSSPKGMPAKLPMPVLPVKPRQTIPVPNLMKPNAFKLTVPPPSLSGRTFKKIPSPSQQIPSNAKLSPPMMNKTSAAPIQVHAQPQDKQIPINKRYPQSFVTIAGKKFIVLPKKARPDTFPPVGNGIGPRGSSMGDNRRPEAAKRVEIVSTSGTQNDIPDRAISQSLAKNDTESKNIADTTDQEGVANAGDATVSQEMDVSVNDNAEVANSGAESVSV